ncbi:MULTISPECIES: tRNA pseudouridine(13) synthase TruD [Gammaproteobacteria]|uniref:tRNA pseudouridine(13) synthase TruD n=1 Tax=Gammaproteobacteria TaxID=1236 RepID=UPI000DCF72F2|nr:MULTISPECIES: tRNA pseudouridine(13) synthase TruD [Gammaproteobacteria]RTE87121.1 tRNA pseudouridine(13) synthase TruD [Aliidiomarina sp. B3213]TCZ93091.1 tRNA pseudouridine(13) synthase TruD [Lysobacter sp. N42]
MDWSYETQKPEVTGTLRDTPQDFQVVEVLGFEPEANERGQHFWLDVEKIDNNTDYVARALAKFAEVPPSSVSYSGLKDRNAVTRQWFSVELNALSEVDWAQFELDNTRVLQVVQSTRKLRRGTHKFNRFVIRVKNLQGNVKQLEQRLVHIQNDGVPNYFGEQRFGRDQHNLAIAESIFSGKKVKNRQARSMALSAARSWIFNHYVSKRLKQYGASHILKGDVMQLSGSNSVFASSEDDNLDELTERLAAGDVRITGPLVGRGKELVSSDAKVFEDSVVEQFRDWQDNLIKIGLEASRRPIWLKPEAFEWELSENELVLSFTLETGAFATAVIRELVDVQG